MQKVENDILTSEIAKKKKDERNVKKNIFVSSGFTNNKLAFKTTLPEGELMKEPIYKTEILHKKYTDMNANTKYYFPQKDENIISENINFKTQWTNRANKILLDNQTLMGTNNGNFKDGMNFRNTII